MPANDLSDQALIERANRGDDDVFAYFFAKFPGFELTASLKTFLYPATKHICLTRLRQRRPNVDIDTVAEELVATGRSWFS